MGIHVSGLLVHMYFQKEPGKTVASIYMYNVAPLPRFTEIYGYMTVHGIR